MRVLLVGSGPVARALGEGWRAGGIEVVSHGGRAPWAASPSPSTFDAIVLAVADRAIADVARVVVEAGYASPATVLVHCAGAVPPEEAFAAVRAAVAGIALCHPLTSIAEASEGQLRGVLFGVAGDEAGMAIAAQLARAVGGEPVRLDAAALARYHAAAALTANHTLALVASAVDLLVGAGIERALAERALASLLSSTARNLTRLGLPDALTGPIARGDAAVVARHLAALPPEAASLYRSTGLRVLELARELGRAPDATLDAVARLLAPISDDR